MFACWVTCVYTRLFDFGCTVGIKSNRHHITLKNPRYMIAVSLANVLDFLMKQQDLILLQWLVSFSSQNLNVFCVKLP